jgi:hypothetical protein
MLSDSSHSHCSCAAAFARQLTGATSAPIPSTFASWSARRVLCLTNVNHRRAHRTCLFAARGAHAKRARSRCAAASTGQARTARTRTRQIQRGHSLRASKAAIGWWRSISRIKHDLHRKNAQSAHSPAKPACGSRAQRLPRRAHVPMIWRAGHMRLGTRPSVGGGRCSEI